MFIKEIQLENYKCFENSTFQFEKQFTTIIGDNGSGKTALLDGIARGLEGLVNVLNPKERSRGFSSYLHDHEVRLIPHTIGSRATLEKTRDNNIKVSLANNISWGFRNTQEGEEYANKLRYPVDDGLPIDLPIIAYYKTSRHWSTEKHEEIKPSQIGSRLDTYDTCLNISTSYKTLLEWFSRMEWIRYKKRKVIPELKAVSRAIVQILKGILVDKSKEIELYFSPENDELIVDIGDGKELPIRLLSDGYRNTLGMVADIAYRMAELNPHLTTNSPGIVLIDELDLHLHPKWQRHIVGDLKRIFPNCQFIVTTHSPFIIQSLESGELLKLDDTPELEYDDFTKKSIEDIAEDEQDVLMPQWSKKRLQMYEAAKEYYQKLETINGNMTEEQQQKLREELQLISKPFASEVAYIAFLEQERLFKEAEINH